ncbi:hypothetical protein C0Q70_11006 [Pomacea canaliculata]|uniref:Sulfatase N-terminal domain-containing protein n=2 Tax=Pomacea canaliculata TaxID=400727 RepID=A0A2T7P4S0_POMCA|nr:arylsulfatase J-like isoform X2 [Pomacea canaliculata]XP_025097897.1 arylsulfatase J-like isoform X2 [Pomacea canaliculata]PVD28419.1 hypothetical protein C0Q70_11006 [Pomacea canaliculata]
MSRVQVVKLVAGLLIALVMLMAWNTTRVFWQQTEVVHFDYIVGQRSIDDKDAKVETPAGSCPESGCEVPKKPHIVFVLADDYGYHDVGYHGSRIKTPNLDRLAAEGVKLERYYVQPMCSPSRTQLMSGRYQIHTGLVHNIIHPMQANALPLDSPTIGDLMKNAGYSTHYTGKWHLGFYKKAFLPTHRGFDSFLGFLTGSIDYYNHKNCNMQHKACGLDLYKDDELLQDKDGVYGPDMYTARALEVIRNHDPTKPLLLFVSHQLVHTPLQVPERYVKPYNYIKDKSRRLYAGMTACLDDHVGILEKALKEKGLWDNTVFIFSSDNGGEVNQGASNWPLRGSKGSHHEGGIRAIGFVTGPLVARKGTVNNQMIHISDWLPTLAHLAGITPNASLAAKLDGYNQWETISYGTSSPRTEFLINIDILMPLMGERLYPDLFDTRVRAGIRFGDYKLITGDIGKNNDYYMPAEMTNSGQQEVKLGNSKGRNYRLFNIIDDPLEQYDLADTHPQLVRFLLKRLDQWNNESVPVQNPTWEEQSRPGPQNGWVWRPWK